MEPEEWVDDAAPVAAAVAVQPKPAPAAPAAAAAAPAPAAPAQQFASNVVPKPASLGGAAAGTSGAANGGAHAAEAAQQQQQQQHPKVVAASAAPQPPALTSAAAAAAVAPKPAAPAAAAAAEAARAGPSSPKRPRIIDEDDDDDDDDDDVPLAARAAPASAAKPAAPAPAAAAAPKAAAAPAPAPPPSSSQQHKKAKVESDSDDDVPLGQRVAAAPSPAGKAAAAAGGGGGGGGAAAAAGPSSAAAAAAAAPRPAPAAAATGGGGTALSAAQLAEKRRMREEKLKRRADRAARRAAKEERRKKRKLQEQLAAQRKKSLGGGGGGGGGGGPSSAARPKIKKRSSAPRPAAARRKSPTGDKEPKWQTLSHAGVLFPPEYEPHGVKMLYDGKPVDLNPAQEEVASLYAAMTGSDYLQKAKFNENFWRAFRGVLGKNHEVQSLAKCDFGPISEHLAALREAKKAATKEEKEAAKRAREEEESKFKFAQVDDRREQVGNFRVEPPGLFRGRGEHPKMGMLKRRIYPRDITINIGPGEAIPTHPYEGQQWKEIRHDNTVTWLAFWKDPISEREYKYVWLAANSTFKADSDLAKYEKARKLKLHIGRIREDYERDWRSKDVKRRQMGVALYFIDKLALRAGHEKDDKEEADTVGCCNLKVADVEALPDGRSVKFDFLGKDSIRYDNTVTVEPEVHALVAAFRARDGQGRSKGPTEQLFDTMDANDLNDKLKHLMEGLSVKVFRTYNASITLDRLLREGEVGGSGDGGGGKGGGGGGGVKDEPLSPNGNGAAGPSSTENNNNNNADPFPYAGFPSPAMSAMTVDGRKAVYDRANKEVAVLCNHQRAVPKAHEEQMGKAAAKVQALEDEVKALKKELKEAKKTGGAAAAAVVQRKLDRKAEQASKQRLAAEVKEDLKTVALGTSKINYLDPRITIAWCKRNEVPIEKVFNRSLMSKFHWAMDCDPRFVF